MTSRVSGSQLTPYQPPQQEFPVHELKIPKYGSFSAALNASRAAWPEGEQASTAAKRKKTTSNILIYVFSLYEGNVEVFSSVCIKEVIVDLPWQPLLCRRRSEKGKVGRWQFGLNSGGSLTKIALLKGDNYNV